MIFSIIRKSIIRKVIDFSLISVHYSEYISVVDSFYWGPELNFEYYDEQQNLKPACKFVSDVIRYWVGEYRFDGIRFDAGKSRSAWNFPTVRLFSSDF